MKLKLTNGMSTIRHYESTQIGLVQLFKDSAVIASLTILVIIGIALANCSETIASETKKGADNEVYGLREMPKTIGKEAWIIDSEDVILIDASDRVIARLAFQASITLLEETPKESRIRVSGWLHFPWPKEARVLGDGKIETPWRGADILPKPSRSGDNKIGEVNRNTHFHYLRRILDKDSHYYHVVLEGYIPSNTITMDFSKTTVPGTVSGRISRKGKPVVGLEVALFNWRSKPAITNSDGQFLLNEVSPGWHAICWRSRGSSTWTYFMIGGSGRGMLKPGGHLNLGEVDIDE